MTDRDITGDIRRTGLNRLPALLGITGEQLAEVADRVRQFDDAQSNETRQRKALEKIATSIHAETTSERRTRENREDRTIRALELMAVAQAYPHEELRRTRTFELAFARLGPKPATTREQGDTP